MSFRMCAYVCVAAVVFLSLSCGDSTSGNGNPAQPAKSGYTITASYPYTSAGDSIVAIVNMNMCDTTVLKHVSTMTMKYQITGDTLFVWYVSSTGDALSQDQSSGILVYLRQGQGTGLIGTWTMIGGKDSLSSALDTTGVAYSSSYITEFTGAQMISYCKGTPAQSAYNSYKALFASMPEYEITVSQPNSQTVRLYGTASGETVSMTYAADNESVTFSSSDQSHAAHIYYMNPSTCPDDAVPTWFYTFLEANISVTTAKRLAIQDITARLRAVLDPMRLLLRR
jgi:hypothetical protein